MKMKTIFKCLFCFKDLQDMHPAAGSSGESSNSNIDQSQILQRFIKLASRYLGQNLIAVPATGVLKSCRSCLSVIESFCEIYHEMKCLELQLYSKLQQLQTMMNLADPTNLATTKFHGNSFETAVEFQKDLRKKCDAKLSKSFPRVVARPLVKSEPREQEAVVLEHVSQLVDFGVVWILSFVGVLFLAINCFANHPEVVLGEPETGETPANSCSLSPVSMKSQKSLCLPAENTAAGTQVMITEMEIEQSIVGATTLKTYQRNWKICRYCSKKFREQKLLTRHKSTCGKIYKRMNPNAAGPLGNSSKFKEFNLKYVRVMVNKDFGCVFCPYTAYTQATVRDHVKESHLGPENSSEQSVDTDTGMH